MRIRRVSNPISKTFAFFLLLSIDYGQALESESIRGGLAAHPCQLPHQVSIATRGQSYCGGSIITASHILTAAHCVFKPNSYTAISPLSVIAGTVDLRDTQFPAQTVSVSRVYVHPHFDKQNLVADIAVLKLARPLRIGDQYCTRIVSLPEGDAKFVGADAVVSGFGYKLVKLTRDVKTGSLRRAGGVVSNDLQYLRAKVLSNKACKDKYYKKVGLFKKQKPVKIYDSFLCAQAKGTKLEAAGQCQGDSGGPLVVKNNIQLGIVSQGPLGCNEIASPGIYTRVSFFRDFIRQAVNDTR